MVRVNNNFLAFFQHTRSCFTWGVQSRLHLAIFITYSGQLTRATTAEPQLKLGSIPSTEYGLSVCRSAEVWLHSVPLLQTGCLTLGYVCVRYRITVYTEALYMGTRHLLLWLRRSCARIVSPKEVQKNNPPGIARRNRDPSTMLDIETQSKSQLLPSDQTRSFHYRQ